MRLITIMLILLFAPSAAADEMTAQDLVRKAMNHWRGLTSYSEMSMTIPRPAWERSMKIRSWSKGEKQTLVRVVEPRKDAGNGTLLDGTSMWTYSPKINRVIKVPSSMMTQSWMGSDFSNKDISKSTDIIEQYDHELTAVTERDGHRFYTITSIPHEDAAVVWGKEVLTIRDDFVLMKQEFWDQDNILVKQLETLEVQEMGGRQVARLMRMGEIDTPEEWTLLTAHEIEFDIDLPESLFTLSSLRNPRQ